MSVSTLRSIRQPYYYDILSPDHHGLGNPLRRACFGAIFQTLSGCPAQVIPQIAMILAAPLNDLLPKDAPNLHEEGFGEIARIEFFSDQGYSKASWDTFEGLIVYTSGRGSIIPLFHVGKYDMYGVNETFGGHRSTFFTSKFVMERCGVPSELIEKSHEDLEARSGYQVILTREAYMEHCHQLVVAPDRSPRDDWRLVLNSRI